MSSIYGSFLLGVLILVFVGLACLVAWYTSKPEETEEILPWASGTEEMTED